MSYATLTQLKSYLGISQTSDDTLLSDLLAQAQAWIDAYTGRTFEAATATRTYGPAAVEGQVLYLDEDLLEVTKLTNGDAEGTEIPSGGYVLLPRNVTPKYAIQLAGGYAWEFGADCYVSVEGTWGYSSAAPADIRAACLILASYLYRLKDSQVMEAISTPDLGIVSISHGIPPQVVQLLNRYRRMGVA